METNFPNRTSILTFCCQRRESESESLNAYRKWNPHPPAPAVFL